MIRRVRRPGLPPADVDLGAGPVGEVARGPLGGVPVAHVAERLRPPAPTPYNRGSREAAWRPSRLRDGA